MLMPRKFPGLRKLTDDLRVATSFLTRIPVGICADGNEISASAWAWPIVGAGIGLAAGSAGGILMAFGAPSDLAALAVILALIMLTGALHEDGLADTADGLGGGGNAESCLRIMKDSRLGSYGALALMLSVLARWIGISALEHPLLLVLSVILAGAFSRTVMIVVAISLAPARKAGLAATAGEPTLTAAVIGALTILPFAVILGWAGLIAIAAAALAPVPVCLLAQRKIGGKTGDIIGAAQQCAEVSVLLVIGWLLT